MVVVMAPTATDEEIAAVVDKGVEAGGEAFVSPGKYRTIIGLVGDTDRFIELPLSSLPGVEQVVRVGRPYELVARELHPEPSTVVVGGHPSGA